LRPGDAMAQVTLIKPHIELIDESIDSEEQHEFKTPMAYN